MHKYKCIFIHIPKNAGSSVLSLFDDAEGRKHAKWYDFYESNDYFFKKYTKFSIVREPTSRLISAYNYCLQGGNSSPSDLALKRTIEEGSDSFDEFVKNILTYEFIMMQPLFLPQYLYIFDREGDCKVDSLLKYECLVSDWQLFSNQHGLPDVLPWTNKSNSTVTEFNLSLSSEEKIKEMYQLDFKWLNY